MNQEVKQKWVEALRSGKYKQAVGGLRRGDSFCCLGVLCDIYGQDHKTKWEKRKDHMGEYYTFSSASGALPRKVVEWAGLSDYRGEYMAAAGYDRHLTEDNDGGKSFSEIADIIEERL